MCLIIIFALIRPSGDSNCFSLIMVFLWWLELFACTFPQVQPSTTADNEMTWKEISDELKKIFKAAVKLLHEKGKMKHSQAKRYLFSGNSHISSVR